MHNEAQRVRALHQEGKVYRSRLASSVAPRQGCNVFSLSAVMIARTSCVMIARTSCTPDGVRSRNAARFYTACPPDGGITPIVTAHCWRAYVVQTTDIKS